MTQETKTPYGGEDTIRGEHGEQSVQLLDRGTMMNDNTQDSVNHSTLTDKYSLSIEKIFSTSEAVNAVLRGVIPQTNLQKKEVEGKKYQLYYGKPHFLGSKIGSFISWNPYDYDYFWQPWKDKNGNDHYTYNNNRKGLNASGIPLFLSFTVEIDHIQKDKQLGKWEAICKALGITPVIIVDSGDNSPETIKWFQDNYNNEVFYQTKFKSGKSYHLTFLIEAAPQSKKEEYEYMCLLFALIASSDVAMARAGQLSRAPSGYGFSENKNECRLQPCVYLNNDPSVLSIREYIKRASKYLASEYGISSKNDIETAQAHLLLFSNLRIKLADDTLLTRGTEIQDALELFLQTKMFDPELAVKLEKINYVAGKKKSIIVETIDSFLDKENEDPAIFKAKAGHSRVCGILGKDTLIYDKNKVARTLEDITSRRINNGMPCYCPVHIHNYGDSNNACIYENDSRYTLTCFVCNKTWVLAQKQVEFSKYLEDMGIDSNKEDLAIITEDHVVELKPVAKALITKYDWKAVGPFYPYQALTRRVTFLPAQQGTGKTVLAGKVAKAHVEAGGRVLWLSHLRSLVKLGQKALESEGIEVFHYLDEKSKSKAGNWCFCIDSLLKYNYALATLDDFDGEFSFGDEKPLLIIIDEGTQLLRSMFLGGKNHDQNADMRTQLIFEYLKRLCSNKKNNVLFMDADLSNDYIEIVQDLTNFMPDEVEARHFDNYVYPFSFELFDDLQEIRLDIQEKVQAGKKLFIGCFSKAEADAEKARLLGLFPNLRIKLFTSETIQELEQQGFSMKDLNDPLCPWLLSIDIIICSPSLQTGVSITVRDFFDDVYIIANERTFATAPDCIQFGRRVRYPKNDKIKIYIQPLGNFNIVNKKKIIDIHNALLSDTQANLDMVFKRLSEDEKEYVGDFINKIKEKGIKRNESLLNNWATVLSATRKAGGDNGKLRESFLLLCDQRGIEVDSFSKNLGLDQIKAEAKIFKDIKALQKEEHRLSILNAAVMPFDTAKNLKETKDNEEYYQKIRAFCVHFFGINADALTMEHINIWQNKADVIRNQAMFQVASQGKYFEIYKRDLGGIHYNSGLGLQNNLNKFILLMKTLKTLGIAKEVQYLAAHAVDIQTENGLLCDGFIDKEEWIGMLECAGDYKNKVKTNKKGLSYLDITQDMAKDVCEFLKDIPTAKAKKLRIPNVNGYIEKGQYMKGLQAIMGAWGLDVACVMKKEDSREYGLVLDSFVDNHYANGSAEYYRWKTKIEKVGEAAIDVIFDLI